MIYGTRRWPVKSTLWFALCYFYAKIMHTGSQNTSSSNVFRILLVYMIQTTISVCVWPLYDMTCSGNILTSSWANTGFGQNKVSARCLASMTCILTWLLWRFVGQVNDAHYPSLCVLVWSKYPYLSKRQKRSKFSRVM